MRVAVFLQDDLGESSVHCLVACGCRRGFWRGKHTQLEVPSLDSCKDWPPQEAAACGLTDAEPRSVAAAAAAAAEAAENVAAAVSADVNGAEAAAAPPSQGWCEKQVHY